MDPLNRCCGIVNPDGLPCHGGFQNGKSRHRRETPIRWRSNNINMVSKGSAWGMGDTIALRPDSGREVASGRMELRS